MRIIHIGLAARHIFDMAGINHLGADPHLLKGGVGTLPVNAGAFHDHLIGLQRGSPTCQLAAILLERTKLTLLDMHRAVGLLN